MNPNAIADEIRQSPEQCAEVDGPLSANDMGVITNKLGVKAYQVYVQCSSGEKLRISVPVTLPIRNTKMGEKAQ